ncbi:MAG TPA: pilus assembly protein TadG-related protein [Gaiellaceae bacterium]|jgi:Flp pilus assembly protein TadG
MTIRSDNRGQTTVLTLVFMTVLLGMAALVLDVGSWYRSDRALQQTADAAALAGAQALPESTGNATGLAIEYADKNGGGLSGAGGGIAFSGSFMANDTIKVNMTKQAPGFFSNVFGLKSVTVGAHASARIGTMNAAQYAAPIGVDIKHPMLSGNGCPCFGQNTTLDLEKVGPGAFRILDIDGSRGGTGQQILGDWITHGLDAYMPLDWYNSDSGAKFNASEVKAALTARIGTELLFPVYRAIQSQGTNLQYEVIGWVGFHLTGFKGNGNSGTLDGWFTRVIWQGIQGQSGSGSPDFGARSVQLVD